MPSKNISLVTNPITSGILGKLVVVSTALIILWLILLTTFLRHASTHIVGVIDTVVLIDFLLWIIVMPLCLLRIRKNHLANAKNNVSQASTLSNTLVIVLMIVVILLVVCGYLTMRAITSGFTLPNF